MQRIKSMAQRGTDGVTSFLDGLVTYVLSREWHDMFTYYIFRLQPVPHCSAEVGVRFGFFGIVRLANTDVTEGMAAPTCYQEASSSEQFSYVVVLIAVAAVAHGLAQRLLTPSVAKAVTSIAGMTVGWAAGDAAVRLLVELMPLPPTASAVVDAPRPDAPSAAAAAAATVVGATSEARRHLAADALWTSGAGGEGFALRYALSVTAVCMVCLLLLGRFVVHALAVLLHRAAEKCCGSSQWADALVDAGEEAMLAVTHLTARAVTMVVLMVWTYVSQLILLSGLTGEQRDGDVRGRLQVLWATSLTLVGALCTEQLVQWREHLEHLAAQEEESFKVDSAALRNTSPATASSAAASLGGSGSGGGNVAPSGGSGGDGGGGIESKAPCSSSSSSSSLETRAAAADDGSGGSGVGVGGSACVGSGTEVSASTWLESIEERQEDECGGRLLEFMLEWLESFVREFARQLLSMTEQMLFFGTGWAWTYVFFPSSYKASWCIHTHISPHTYIAIHILVHSNSWTCMVIHIYIQLYIEHGHTYTGAHTHARAYMGIHHIHASRYKTGLRPLEMHR